MEQTVLAESRQVGSMSVAVWIPQLCDDLAEESEVLHALVDPLSEDAWNTPTPAVGWTIKDEIGHLAFFDGAVTTAVRDPAQFVVERDAARASVGAFVNASTAANRGRTGEETNEWFRSARAAMVTAFMRADPSGRVPWYGPEMSVASALTARIMETWAHGQDVFDALGVRHPVTSALRQVAHIGVRALPNSFVAKRGEVPVDPVRVDLTAPDGEEWSWGPDDATNRVSGPADDFCLVVTQRRHVDDTRIRSEGVVASEWMSIAQAFAGPPGDGRRPGQFPPLH